MNRFSHDFVYLLHFPALGNTHWNLQDINATPVETKQTEKKNVVKQQKYASEASRMDQG